MTGNRNRGVLGEEPEETEPPAWYLNIRASRYSNGAYTPEQLENMPTTIRDRYLMAESAELKADEIKRKQNERKPKRGKHGRM